ncbi:MAG: hypothetical protein QOH91_69 [Mycobacterium sp.]|jgi:hypothetical protein|nr:hypothetical protein [Mycobacterium sp.]
MGFRSPLVLMSTVGLFTLGFLAPWGAPKAVADGDRLGCGTYCQNAGQYGAAGQPPPSPVTILSSGTVTVDADGYVPVTLKCNATVQCHGALMLDLRGYSNPQESMPWVTGRSDLVVNAGATRTIGVPVAAGALALVRSQGPTPVGVVADTNPMYATQLGSATLTLAAPG